MGYNLGNNSKYLFDCELMEVELGPYSSLNRCRFIPK